MKVTENVSIDFNNLNPGDVIRGDLRGHIHYFMICQYVQGVPTFEFNEITYPAGKFLLVRLSDEGELDCLLAMVSLYSTFRLLRLLIR